MEKDAREQLIKQALTTFRAAIAADFDDFDQAREDNDLRVLRAFCAVGVYLSSKVTNPTSMYCPPPVCLQWTASVFAPPLSNSTAAWSSGTSTYCVE